MKRKCRLVLCALWTSCTACELPSTEPVGEAGYEYGPGPGLEAGAAFDSGTTLDSGATPDGGMPFVRDVPDAMGPSPTMEAQDARPERERAEGGTPAPLEPVANRPDGGSSPAPVSVGDAGAPAISDAGKAARTVLVRGVPEAENLFFTPAGRLFVSGGENVFEIKRNEQGLLYKVDLFHEACLVEGIAQSGTYLYGVCSRTGFSDFAQAYFFGGEISDAPELRILARLADGIVPNGMAVDAHGRIYISCSGAGQILRITLSTPGVFERSEVWAQNLTFVNGLKLVDGSMYFTALSDDLLASRLGRLTIAADGSAGAPEYLFERSLTVLDDILPYDGGFVITDYLAGTLIFWKAGGVYGETPAETFFAPTALVRGRPPMFSERDLLVTEKGVIFVEDASEEGDLLSRYRLDP